MALLRIGCKGKVRFAVDRKGEVVKGMAVMVGDGNPWKGQVWHEKVRLGVADQVRVGLERYV